MDPLQIALLSNPRQHGTPAAFSALPSAPVVPAAEHKRVMRPVRVVAARTLISLADVIAPTPRAA
jgi:hypothetical protein